MKEKGRGTGCGPELLTLVIIASAVLIPLAGFFVLRLRLPQQRDLRLEWTTSTERATAGDVITYTLTLYNVGIRDGLEVITVTDSLLGDLSPAVTSHLADGTSDREVFTRTVLPGDPDVLTSTVVAYAAGAGEVFSATATTRVDLLKPAIRVEALAAPPTVAPGDVVTYTIAVANVGEVLVEIIAVTDSLLGDLSASFAPTLTVGRSDRQTFAWEIPEDAGDALRRRVTVQAAGAGEVVTASAIAAVDRARPVVQIETVVNPAVAQRGEEVTFTVIVSNGGRIGLEDVQVTDSLLGDVSTAFPESFDPGATAQEGFVWSIPADASGPLGRRVAVTARAAGEEVSAAGGAELALVGVAVDVTGTRWIAGGERALQTVVITNTSSVGAPDLVLERVTELGGDDVAVPDACATLAGGEVCSFTYEIAVPSDEDSLTTGVDVAYRPEGLAVVVTAAGSHAVEVFRPSVAVNLGGPTLSQAGERVSYVVALTNTSSGEGPDLVLERAVDARVGELAVPDACRVLPGGETCSFSYDSVVPTGVDPLVTTVEVAYRPEGLSDAVLGAANHSVEVFQSSIAVDKTGPAEGVEGETVTYSVSITNTSSDNAPDLILEAVRDSLGGDLLQPGDDFTSTCPDRLSSGDTCRITYAYALLPRGPRPLVSTVAVEARPLGFDELVTTAAEQTMAVEVPWERGTGLPVGIEVRTMAICPADPDVLYVGFGSRGRGVYRSEDGGVTWAPTGLTDEGVDVFGLAVDPEDCDTVYAGAWRDGVRKTEDAGISWASSGGLEGAFVYSVVVDPGDANVLYAGTALRGAHRSQDGGVEWSPWGLEGLAVPHLSVAGEGRVVYAATWGEGVRRRQQRGATWGPWTVVGGDMGAHGQVYGVAVDPEDAARVYAATAAAGVYRTRDGDGAWERVLASPERVYTVAVDAREGMVFAGTEAGLYVSASGEMGSWEAASTEPGEQAVRCVVMGPDTGEYVHVGAANGAWRRRR